MSRWRVTFEFEVDDEELAAHNGDNKPPPNDVTDWYDTDLFSAYDYGFVTLDHEGIDLERVADRND